MLALSVDSLQTKTLSRPIREKLETRWPITASSVTFSFGRVFHYDVLELRSRLAMGSSGSKLLASGSNGRRPKGGLDAMTASGAKQAG